MTTEMRLEKPSKRTNDKTKLPTKASNRNVSSSASQRPDARSQNPSEAWIAMGKPTPSNSLYFGRLDLTRCCHGLTPLTRASIDLTSVLADKEALEAMSNDLFRPFHQSHVDMVVGVLEDGPSAHGFTATIAGVMAGRYDIALGQVTVHRARPPQPVEATAPSPRPRAKKRGRPASKNRKPPVMESDSLIGVSFECQRIASFLYDPTGLSVEYRRELVPSSSAGTRILLVTDWVESLDPLVAAREALIRAGADVIGVAFVVGASSTVLEELSKKNILYSCSWTPTSGAQLTLQGSSVEDSVRCQCDASDATTSSKRPKVDSIGADLEFQYVTNQYEANSPSEDRSINAVKPSDSGVRLFAVLDGHGGSVAVDHLKKTLCNEVFERVTSESTSEEVESALTQAFLACDDSLKTFLEELPLEIRMSKGYCNAGSCAVVALVVHTKLYVANVGDCGAVIGYRDHFTDRLWTRELSTEHNCRNAIEIKLVMERSRDRNAIRLSKDDQENENVYGVRRVAGSLAVTRAFGDFYLKCEELSTAPFKSKVPYITVEPSICQYNLQENDAEEQTLILASDGLWELVGSAEAVKIVHQFDTNQSVLFPSPSAALVHVVLEKVAHRDGMLLHELMALPRGRERRRYHDDITCTVIRIKSSRRRLSSADTLEESDLTRVTDEEQSQT